MTGLERKLDQEHVIVSPGGIELVYTTASDCLKRTMAFLNEVRKENKEGHCTKCGRLWKLTVDHIVPQDILNDFGIDSRKVFIKSNLEVVCEMCNHYKGNRLDFTNKKTIPLLKELISLMGRQ